MYTMNCGCVFDAMVYDNSYSCCGGGSYEIEDAYIITACESHGG